MIAAIMMNVLRLWCTMMQFGIFITSLTGISVTAEPCVHFASEGLEVHCESFKHNQCAELRQQFPHLYNVTDLPVVNPTTPHLTSSCKPDKNDVSVPQVEIEWKLAQRDGAEKTRGFEVQFDTWYLRDARCLIITFVNNVTKTLLKTSQPKFRATFFPSHPSAKWTYPRVYSLPSGDPSLEKSQANISIPKCERPLAANRWCPQRMDSVYDATNKTLTVNFTDPPSYINIDQFWLKEWDLDATGTLINQTNHTYLDVEPGNYSFSIAPHEPYAYVPGKCVCLDENWSCNQCRICYETTYDVHVPLQSPTEGGEQKPETDVSDIVATSIACFVIICVIVTSGICWRYRYKRCSHCFRKNSKYKRLLAILETDENSSELQTFKSLIKPSLSPDCHLCVVQFNNASKDKLSACFNNLSGNTSQHRHSFRPRVCLCLPLSNCSRNNVTKEFLGLVNNFNLTFAANARTIGIVLTWDTRTYELGNRLVHYLQLPDETEIMYKKLVYFLKPEAELNSSDSMSGNMDGHNCDTINDCRLDLIAEPLKGRKRYTSNNDSGLGDNVPFNSNLQIDSHMFEDIDNRRYVQGDDMLSREALHGVPDLHENHEWICRSYPGYVKGNTDAQRLQDVGRESCRCRESVEEGCGTSLIAPSLSRMSMNCESIDGIMDELVALNHRSGELKDSDAVTFCSGRA